MAHQGKQQKNKHFMDSSGPWQNSPEWPQIGLVGFFPTNPDLADMLGRMDLNSDNFYVFDFVDTNFLDFQVPRSPNSQISRFPDFQTPALPDELSDPNLTSLPMHPGIKYVARRPCCDLHWRFIFCSRARAATHSNRQSIMQRPAL